MLCRRGADRRVVEVAHRRGCPAWPSQRASLAGKVIKSTGLRILCALPDARRCCGISPVRSPENVALAGSRTRDRYFCGVLECSLLANSQAIPTFARAPTFPVCQLIFLRQGVQMSNAHSPFSFSSSQGAYSLSVGPFTKCLRASPCGNGRLRARVGVMWRVAAMGYGAIFA
jgi:hypothetical protein